MILDWLSLIPVLLTALAVVLVPGALAMWAAGMRGLAVLAAAPLFSVATTGITALALGLLGVPWSGWTWAAGTVALVVLAFVAGRLLGGRLTSAGTTAPRWILPVSLGIGALIGIWVLASYITDPAGISQTNDAVFHMNAVQFILDTSDASSLHVNGVIGGTSFYPAAWHAIVSLIVSTTGTTIPIAANMLTLVIGGAIWPLGIAWLTRVATGSALTAALAAILSGALHTFPLLMFQWGVLFPNALSTAMLPAAVALMISLPAWRSDDGRWRVITRAVLLGLVAFSALLLAQPATTLPWLALVLVRLTAGLAVGASNRSRRGRWAIIVAAWAGLAVFWVVLSRGTSGSHWPPFRGKLEVFLDVLFNGQLRLPFAFVVSALMLWGLVAAWRSPVLRWIVFGWVGISALYVLVAAIGAPLIRVNVLGAWYADPYRIAALAPVMAVPLAAVGLHSIIRIASAGIRRSGRTKESTDEGGAFALIALAAAALVVVVVVVVRPVAMPAVIEGTFDRESRYVAVADSYLSPDERALLESLDDLVEPGERVLSNPSTGAGFGYMLSGVDVFPRTWSAPRTAAWSVIAAGLRDAATDPAVCDALHEYGDPEYVLDFGPGEDTPGRYEMPGMTDFDGEPGFVQVAGEGDVSLWRITACARRAGSPHR